MVSIYPFGLKGPSESRTDLYNWVSGYHELFDNIPNEYKRHINDKDKLLVYVAYSDSRGNILDNEIFRYLYSDLYLSIISLSFIFFIVWLFLRSFLLTVFSLIGVLIAFIPSILLFQYVWGSIFNLANFVSLWIILGIGADDIFVFVSFYRRSMKYYNDDKLRMGYAYSQAGGAMFVTSFTTAMSFYSLCLSRISPLPQFGFFIATLVLINFVLVMTYFPCLLQLYVWLSKYNPFQTFCPKYIAINMYNNDSKKNAINIDNEVELHSVKPKKKIKKQFKTISGGDTIFGEQLDELNDEENIDEMNSTVQNNNNNENNNHSNNNGNHNSNHDHNVATPEFAFVTEFYFKIMTKGVGILLILITLIFTLGMFL